MIAQAAPDSAVFGASRVARYLELILAAPYEICIERARYFTEAHRESQGLTPSIRAARGFENTVRKMTVRIGDCEGIAGNQTSKLVSAALPVERGDINTSARARGLRSWFELGS